MKTTSERRKQKGGREEEREDDTIAQATHKAVDYVRRQLCVSGG
jgi:hypothetical protein